MKTTLDIPEDLYRAVKAKSAMDGMSVRSVTLMLYGSWLAGATHGPTSDELNPVSGAADRPLPSWFARGRANIRRNAGAECGMETLREAIGRGVASERLAGSGK